MWIINLNKNSDIQNELHHEIDHGCKNAVTNNFTVLCKTLDDAFKIKMRFHNSIEKIVKV